MGQLSVDLSARMKDLPLQPKPVSERKGVVFPRYFTARLEPGQTPYDEVQWETRTASIGNDKGAVIFEQRDVEIPADWSQTATNIVASKYFHGKLGAPERETSVAQLVHRVVDTIADWGLNGGLLPYRGGWRELPVRTGAPDADPEGVLQLAGLVQRRRERDPRVRLDIRRDSRCIQKLKSGVLRPQCSACFIVSVKDSLESILDLAKTEGMLFKWGSGTGSNLSPLREEDALSPAAAAPRDRSRS